MNWRMMQVTLSPRFFQCGGQVVFTFGWGLSDSYCCNYRGNLESRLFIRRNSVVGHGRPEQNLSNGILII